MTLQKILILYAGNSSFDADIIGFSIYDPTEKRRSTDVDTPMPYKSVLEAMKDGWRVIQVPTLQMKYGHETENDYLEFEFVLEKLVELENE
ncbi:MAG: hypothetical protein MK193_02710 [Lentisphaeria bacterium]|nr:hypothetical protein [Lentisphaeria bacterium]